MIATEIKVLAVIAVVSGAFSSGMYVQGARMGLQIEKLEHAATSSQLASAERGISQLTKNQQGITDTLKKLSGTQQRNAKSQADLDRVLRDLRTDTAGLRGDFADLPRRVSTASVSTLGEYATACTAVFDQLAAAGGRMAERGANLAKQAEGHAADARMMREAWPK